MCNYKKVIVFCVLSIFILLPSLASAASIAKVIAVTGGANIERAGKTQALALKDDLLVGDVVRTDASGKVQFIFNDDSVVNVGNNSMFTVEDYSDAGSKSFKSNVAVGFARFVTGSIVAGNPDAFAVRTPEATVGIRGTTLAVLTFEGVTQVSTENSLKQQSVVVGELVVPPGYTASFGLGGALSSPLAPMTDLQRNMIIDQSTIDTSVLVVGQADIASDFIDEDDLDTDDLDDLEKSLSDTVSLAEAIGSANATVSGTLSDAAVGDVGSFSFQANILTGSISNGSLDYSLNGDVFTGRDGVGSIDDDDFELGGNGVFISGAGGGTGNGSWKMEGDTGIVAGQSVNGEWEFDSTLAGGSGSGDFTGTVKN